MRRRAVVLSAAALGALAAAAFLVGCRGPDSQEELETTEIAPIETLDIEGDELRLQLLYPGSRGRLHTEERLVPLPEERSDLLRLTVGELFAGPSEPGLLSPFPPDVALADVLLTADGTAYIDLSAPHLSDPPPSGSKAEMLAVYSVVNTVLLNVPEARSVVLLWNGVQRPSFAGHLDTSRPLALKPDLIAQSG